MKHNELLTSLLLLGISLLLASCGQTPSKPLPESRESTGIIASQPDIELTEPTEPELEAMREALTQAELAWAEANFHHALSLAQTIRYSALSDQDQLRGLYLQAQLDSVFSAYPATLKAHQALLRYNLEPLGLRTSDIEERIYQLAVRHQDHATTVRYGLLPLLNPKVSPEYRRDRLMSIATAISHLKADQLIDISRQLPPTAQTVLASVAQPAVLERRNVGANLCQQWNDSNAFGTISANVCHGDASETGQGALLIALPLSGRLKVAGEAILDGILFSHLNQAKRADLHIVDTEEVSDEALLSVLQTGQFSSMIGPLEKSRVQSWLTLSQATQARILALNTPENLTDSARGQHFYQLALSPEAEATFLADTVYGSGARRILIIRPQTDWGARTLLALRTRWQALGGVETATATYRGQEDYESSLRVALGVADSAARRRTLGRLSGLSMHLQARRREDIDAVIMLASSPEEARSIKPLLAFHFAEDLPVFALSAANDLPQQVDHKDLDDVVTLDIESLQPIPNETPSSPALARLIALGIDAYALSQLPELNAPLKSLYRGRTGLLWVDEQGFVQRRWKVLKYDKDERKTL